MTEKKLKKKVNRRITKQWIQVEVTEVQCAECGEWFLPKEQPPRSSIEICFTSKCRVRKWRRDRP